MKNIINYYYGLVVTDIIKKDKNYKFIINNIEFLFKPCLVNIDSVLEIYKYNYINGIYCHEIIFNKDSSPITFYNGTGYVLIKKLSNSREKIELNSILNYNIPININKSFNWGELWSKKIDYYEYQVNQFGKKFPLIRDSFSYYDGMMETAISLSNFIDKKNLTYYLNHNRIKLNESLDDFYNPLEFVLDVKVRDICEYFKEKFFSDEFDFSEVETYLYSANLTKEEAILFMSRLLFPSYYFDLYDEIIQGNQSEEKINKYINNIEDYEIFLYKVYLILKTYYPIPEIEWIKKCGLCYNLKLPNINQVLFANF